MHELSLAINIVEIVENEIKKHNQKFSSVETVTLEIGQLSGVEIVALKTAIEEASKNTILKKTEFIYNIISAVAVCDACKKEFETNDYFTPCPFCGNPFSDISKGKDLIVSKISLE